MAVDPHDATLLVETEHPEALFQRVRMVLAGEYEVERELARGGMGVIFKATEVGLRRAVALKVLPPELGLSVKVAERFKREARMVAELDHPNIIPVYRIGQLGGIFFIAMKFIEGRSLGLMIDTQGALPVPVALQVLRGDTRAGVMQHHFFSPAPDVRQARDDVPAALAEVLNRTLKKDPAARFSATRDMLTALEAIPFSEGDRRESEQALRQLVQGTAIAKVPARSLPPLPESPTMPLAPAVPRRRRRLPVRVGVAASGVLLLGLALGVMRLTARRGDAPLGPAQVPAPPPTVQAAKPPPAAEPRAARPSGGKLRVLTSPSDAEILIDGRRVGVGSAFDLPLGVGERRLEVRAAGYKSFDTTLVVTAGSTGALVRIPPPLGEPDAVDGASL